MAKKAVIAQKTGKTSTPKSLPVKLSAPVARVKKKTGPKPVARNKLDSAGEQTIISMITAGEGYRAIARKFDVSVCAVFAWIEQNTERSHACARASELASHTEDDKALEGIEQAADMFELAKAKELAIHRRWRAKALAPKKYGDRQTVDLNATIELKPEQVQEKLERLIAKAAGK